jgi:hypothetical protein
MVLLAQPDQAVQPVLLALKALQVVLLVHKVQLEQLDHKAIQVVPLVHKVQLEQLGHKAQPE